MSDDLKNAQQAQRAALAKEFTEGIGGALQELTRSAQMGSDFTGLMPHVFASVPSGTHPDLCATIGFVACGKFTKEHVEEARKLFLGLVQDANVGMKNIYDRSSRKEGDPT